MLLDTLTLPDDLKWMDEFTWTPVVQKLDYGVTGSLFIQESLKLKGRHLTFVGVDNMGWINRGTADQLLAWMNIPDKEMTLTLQDARAFNVRFRQGDNPVDIQGIFDVSLYTATEWFRVNALRFIET